MSTRNAVLLVPTCLCIVTAAAAPSPRTPSLDPPTLTAEKAEAHSEGLEQPATHGAPATEWVLHKTADGLHPDGHEQQMVWLMNRARRHPRAEGIWLAHLRQYNVQSAMNYFQVLRDLLMDEFAALSPTRPAAFDRRLYLAAKNHSDYLVSIDGQNHNDQFNRVSDAGCHLSSARGSVFSYADDPVYGHAGFNVDWGGNDGTGMQTGRGHRQGLMGSYANAGIACVVELDPGTAVGELVTTINYCNAQTAYTDHFNRFIVGTVWDDLNDNAMYDPGEGRGGVQVLPDAGTYYAVTGDAGGYAIPVDAGTYTLTFSGGGLAQPVTRTVTVDTDSVLVEWVDRSLPGRLPASVAFHADGTLTYTLAGQKKGIGYRLARTGDLAGGSWAWTGIMPSGYGDALTYTAGFTNSGDPRCFMSLQGWSY